MIFVSVCILANDKHCLITGHIHIDFLPDHCSVALGLVSDSQYLQNQALNNTGQAGQMSPRMSHDPGSLLSKDHSSALIGWSGLEAHVPIEKHMHNNQRALDRSMGGEGAGPKACRAAFTYGLPGEHSSGVWGKRQRDGTCGKIHNNCS